jgi:hypothetical protein
MPAGTDVRALLLRSSKIRHCRMVRADAFVVKRARLCETADPALGRAGTSNDDFGNPQGQFYALVI